MDYMVTDPCSGNILQCGPRDDAVWGGKTCREKYKNLARYGSTFHELTTEWHDSLYWDGLTCVLWPRPRYQQNARVDSQRPTRARAQV